MDKRNSVIAKIDDYYCLADKILNGRNNQHQVITSTIGFSMHPTILPDDKIVIDESQIKDLCPGDIITFVQNSLFVCHRIIEVITRDNQKFFITKGDSAKMPDEKEISIRQIAGKVVSVIRKNKYIDIYSYKPSFLSKVLFEIKKNLLFSLSTFKRKLGQILIYVQLNPLYKITLGKFIFWIIKNKNEYYFSLPRKKESFIAYRYIDIPLEDILNKDENFLKPLDNIGGFKITANLKGNKIAIAEIIKVINKDEGRSFWTITEFNIRFLYRGTGIEEQILRLCYSMLNLIKVNELYFLTAEKENILPVYLKKWNARFITRYKNSELYLLSKKEATFPMHENLFSSLLKVIKWLAARLLFLLQGRAIFRKILKRFFHPVIKYSFEEKKKLDKAKESNQLHELYVFIAKHNGKKIGSVWLVKRIKNLHPEWWIHSLEVKTLFRGLGIGIRLINYLIDFAKEKGMERLYLTVDPKKKPAIKCYKKLDFLEKGTDLSEKLILMERVL